MHGGVAREVHEGHRPALLVRGLQHGQCGGDADAATDQRQWPLAGREHELTGRREQIDRGAGAERVVQVVRHPPARLALDADAVGAAVRRGGQRVIAPYFLPVDLELEADVLAGLERHHRAAVGGLQIQRGDLGALRHLAADLETARTAPAAGRRRGGGVDVFLGADQQIRELLVGGAPGLDHGVGRDVRPQHLADRPQQAAADDGVMLGQHLQRHMLLHDLPDQRAERVEAVDVPGVLQDAVRERPRLGAARLVRLIEQRAHLGVFAEHDAVEVARQRLAAGFEQWDGGLDDVAVLGGKHWASSKVDRRCDGAMILYSFRATREVFERFAVLRAMSQTDHALYLSLRQSWMSI